MTEPLKNPNHVLYHYNSDNQLVLVELQWLPEFQAQPPLRPPR